MKDKFSVQVVMTLETVEKSFRESVQQLPVCALLEFVDQVIKSTVCVSFCV